MREATDLAFRNDCALMRLAPQMRAYFTELDSHLTECQQQIEKLIRRQISTQALF